MNQRILALAGLLSILGGCYFASGQTATPAAVATVATEQATPAPTATVELQPATGEGVRVEFERGSYGTTLLGATSTKYLLWADQGQVFTVTLTANSTSLASLYGPDGAALYEQLAAGNTAAATLPTSGDFSLEIRASGGYTVGVEIR